MTNAKDEFLGDFFADLPRAQRTNRSRCGLKPGACPHCIRYLEIDGMGHGFTVNGKFHDALVPTVLEWMKQQLDQ